MRALMILALVAPMPAFAQDAQRPRLFSLPPGCTAYVTIQAASCTLSHHFTCEGDPEGWQRRVDLDEEGVTYFGSRQLGPFRGAGARSRRSCEHQRADRDRAGYL
jgi:hypothetical protein